MEEKKVLLGLFVALAITACFVMAGCLGTDDGFSGDTALNGTWVRRNGTSILLFDNGNFDYFEDTPFYKGTYTTNNGMVIEKWTHIYSGNNEVKYTFLEFGLEANRWYSMSELKSLGGAYFSYLITMEGVDPGTFEKGPISYYVQGNRLYYGEATYTRQ